MPDDAQHFPSPLASVALPITAPPRPNRQAFATIFTTQDAEDAICAGFEGSEFELGESGGFAIHADSRGIVTVATLQGVDGEVQIAGFHAIREARKALEVAEAIAKRHEGVV